MNFQQFPDTPFELRISFHKIIEQLEQTAASGPNIKSESAKALLKEIEPFPELKNGITSIEQIYNNTTVISHLLADIFPAALTNNEIKAVTVPFQNIAFNHTQRFQNILKNAGPSFDLTIRDFSSHQFYVICCCLILNKFYGTKFDFAKPLFYDIPTAEGIIKHYRILYNADFLEIVPTEKALSLSQDEVTLLMDNFDNLDLWKQKFPSSGWIVKGFALLTLIDSTVENAVSALKGELLGASPGENLKDRLESIFRSIYLIPDLRIGFTAYNKEEHKFTVADFNQHIKSFLLHNHHEEDCFQVMQKDSFKKIVEKRSYLSISDSEKLLKQNPDSNIAQNFFAQNIRSFILAPIIKNNQLLGILELVSSRPGELNSINANRLEVVMPFFTDTIDRQYTDLQNRLQALIQKEYTTIHASVYWKFKKEALNAIQCRQSGKEYTLKEVTFKDVYALYGQIDIKGSSETRNLSIQQDIRQQLTAVITLFEQLKDSSGNLAEVEKIQQLQALIMDISMGIRADTEQTIQHYLELEIDPILKQAHLLNPVIAEEIDRYFKQSDLKTGDFHIHRRKYQTTVTLINEKMALILDRWQQEVQKIFPHYYERFKTDGVEHNMYIGAAITPDLPFELSHLYNLRLWQLQVLCEMEMEHHFSKTSLPYPLEVTSLVLAFSPPISIRFRMDEKRFDIDGTYNARFEVVKKRIDKAFIKGTEERITATGKITIVYSSQEEQEEYMEYIRFLQSKKMLDEGVEMLEVEDLQGVYGLKALRIKIMYVSSLPARKCYDYEELVKLRPEQV